MTNTIQTPASLPDGDEFFDQPVSVNTPQDDIVSVNSKGSNKQGSRAAKTLFVLLATALLIGLLVWFGQKWVTDKKNSLHPMGNKPTGETADLVNPEKSVSLANKPKLGAESGLPPVDYSGIKPGASDQVASADGVRPLRDAAGKVILNGQGRAMGVDVSGRVVEVPAIQAMGGEADGKKPLPGQAVAGQPVASNGGATAAKPPSRFGGALFIDGAASPSVSSATPGGAAGGPTTMQSYADILKVVQTAQGGAPSGGVRPPTPSTTATPYFGQPITSVGGGSGDGNNSQRPGTVGSQLVSSATPVARAKSFGDQNLVLPKGRQADCVLTGRIIDEVPGFTSCALTQNMYSDNGRVLLLERGSELTGEYGTSTQLGTRRLFVTWTRAKTPGGIEIDLSSPGSDSLGTSGIPGYLDNRWSERIGAALLLSFIKDVAVAVVNNQNNNGSTGTSVTVQQPGQNTAQAGFSIADEVVRQTIKVRPTLSINEGERVSIYVARDLDFSPVYALRSTGTVGSTKVKY